MYDPRNFTNSHSMYIIGAIDDLYQKSTFFMNFFSIRCRYLDMIPSSIFMCVCVYVCSIAVCEEADHSC